MKRISNNRSSLFLMELIIAILFFSLGSAVCVQAFVQAQLTTRSAQQLSFASSAVSSAASVMKYTDGSFEAVQSCFPSAEENGSVSDYAIYYDDAFQTCSRQEAVYTLYIQSESARNMANTHIWFATSRDGETLYELQLRYPPWRAAA